MSSAGKTIRFIRPAQEACLVDVAEMAVRESLNLVTNGVELILCSIVPTGWRKFAVKYKPTSTQQIVFPRHSTSSIIQHGDIHGTS